MSRAAEERAEARMKLVEEKAKKDYVVGATVYWPNYDHVEEGKVVKVAPCRLNSRGDPQEDPEGSYTLYYAQFQPGGPWHSQTYPWKFFVKASVARAKLVRQIEDRIEEGRRAIEKMEQLIKANKTLGVEVLLEDTC